VPAVVDEPVSEPDASAEEPAADPAPVDLEERRGRKGRRIKETFEGLPPAAFS
jgi:hypothetical protein